MVYLCIMSDWHFVSEITCLSLFLIKIQQELDMNVLVWTFTALQLKRILEVQSR